MDLTGGKKEVTQGVSKKYDAPDLGSITNQGKDNDTIEFNRVLLSIDGKLNERIEDYIHTQKKNGVKMLDEKTGYMKKINFSIWARKVLKEALDKEERKQSFKR